MLVIPGEVRYLLSRLEQKGYEKMVNEIVPVQQAEAYRKPTNKAVKEAVKELNPDTNSLGSRG